MRKGWQKTSWLFVNLNWISMKKLMFISRCALLISLDLGVCFVKRVLFQTLSLPVSGMSFCFDSAVEFYFLLHCFCSSSYSSFFFVPSGLMVTKSTHCRIKFFSPSSRSWFTPLRARAVFPHGFSFSARVGPSVVPLEQRAPVLAADFRASPGAKAGSVSCSAPKRSLFLPLPVLACLSFRDHDLGACPVFCSSFGSVQSSCFHFYYRCSLFCFWAIGSKALFFCCSLYSHSGFFVSHTRYSVKCTGNTELLASIVLFRCVFSILTLLRVPLDFL
jgi:hypothetical protein